MGKRLAPLVLLLVLSAGLFYVLLRSPPAWTLPAGAPGDTRFLDGFSVREESNGTSFRWSLKESRFRLHGTSTLPAFTLDMHLYGNERAHAGDWFIGLEREGQPQPIARFPMRYGWRTYRVLVPHHVAARGLEAAPLLLTSSIYSHTPEDHRDLGVPLAWVRVTPLAAASPLAAPPLWRALVLVWMLALLAALLWWLDSLLLPRHRHTAPLRVGLLTGAAAVVLAWFTYHHPYPLAWILPAPPWTLALLTLVLLAHRWLPSPTESPPALPPLRPSLLPLALIFLVALVLRCYRLDTLPYGLWRDEANHALIALRILHDPTYRPVYAITSSVNMPALGLYPFALALKWWGIHAWSLRPITALAGALTIFPLYGVVVRLTVQRSTALLAAAFLAVSSWHITISRFSFPAIFDPLLTLSGVWLLLYGLDVDVGRDTARSRWVRGLALLLAGGCIGLAVQTYHTGRIAPVVAGMLALLLLMHAPRSWKRWLVGVSLSTIAFVLITAPLLHYAIANPDAFNNRVGGVFLLSEEALHGRAPLAALDDSLGRHLLMFNVRGDSNGRHHAPHRPLLDFVTGIGFVVGGLMLLRRLRDWRMLFVAVALVLGVLPSLLAVEGPHAMRSIDAAAFACAIAAIGWGALLQRIPAGIGQRTRPVLVAAVAVVAVALALNVWVYFVAMPTNREVWTSFYPVHTQIGGYLREMANEEGRESVQHIYVQEKLTRNAVLRYLTDDLPVQTFDGTQVSRRPAPNARLILSGYAGPHDRAKLAPLIGDDPVPVERGPVLPDGKTPSFTVYRVIR